MNSNGKIQPQQGSALIVSLIILLLMTILGVTGMQTTTMQDRMAGNMKDRNLAFQAAEAALRAGESETSGSHQDLPENFKVTDPEAWFDYLITQGHGNSYASSQMDGLHSMPRYYIETLTVSYEESAPLGEVVDDEFGQVSEKTLQRVTAIGFGASESTVVVLQSTKN